MSEVNGVVLERESWIYRRRGNRRDWRHWVPVLGSRIGLEGIDTESLLEGTFILPTFG